jgi:hypothetical protein
VRKRLIGALLVSLTVALPPPAASAQSSPTNVVVYSPFRVGEGLVEKVLWHSPGICKQGSIADPRADAWLCSNAPACHRSHCILIHDFDPCFSGSRTAGYVVCPVSPTGEAPAGAAFGAYVMRLNLREPLPVTSADAGGPDTNGNPIAIRLTNGDICTLEQVPPTAPGLNPVSAYQCPKGYALASSLDRTGATWTIDYDSRDYVVAGPSETTSVQIATAYW